MLLVKINEKVIEGTEESMIESLVFGAILQPDKQQLKGADRKIRNK